MAPRILLVDDSPMIHRIVGKILTDYGFAVLKASDGRKGYEMARESSPDLIIMDLEMPEMDGIEAAGLIASDPKTSGIPVVMLTSLSSEADMARAREVGVKMFLNKPLSREDILSSVENILGNKDAE